MIETINGNKVLTFGDGDIKIETSMFEDETKETMVMFTQGEIGDIGRVGNSSPDRVVVPSEYAEVLFWFKDWRSIDVVIDKLSRVKASMTKNGKETGNTV